MKTATYYKRIDETAQALAARHNNGEKITYTIAWNAVYIYVFNHGNFAKVNGVYRYMPETIARVRRKALTMI